MWNMKVTVKPIVIYALSTVTKGLVGWLFSFTVYQPFSGHLTPNLVICIKVSNDSVLYKYIGWFLFNGISTFVGYLMPKPFS